MSTANLLQICLLLGVFVPLLSFVFLAFFGTKLPPRRELHGHGDNDHGDAGHGHSHDEHTHGGHGGHSHGGHDEHGHGYPPKVKPVPGGNPTAGWVAVLAIGFSLLMASIVLAMWLGTTAEGRAELTAQAVASEVLWANLGAVPIKFGVRLDSLTIIMFFMVALCATCIHVFSVGYMAHDARFPRFFTYLSLFCFSMLGLVISVNVLFLFIFWELVGLCSYLLIGFWFEKKSASNAAMKAFITNRVGDFGFLIGMMLVYVYLGDLSLTGSAAVFEAAAHHAGEAHGALTPAAAAVAPAQAAHAAGLFSTTFWGVSLATWMGIGLFCGAIGKSAQFPLQVWLPDAMEGPTPVSALIHAATMVAAGVYLVGRIFTLLTPDAQLVIASIGCITLTMAALIAIVQTDIKRVLAYSTLSQLGYMIYGMGVGAWIAALFHLLTHAFFKAMMFLGSGQVIEACHHEQDMRRMGGLRSKLPVTAFTFLVAVLAISGAGIPWTQVGIGGFYSKDEILAVAHARHFGWGEASPADPHAAPAHAAADGPAYVTAGTTDDQEHGTQPEPAAGGGHAEQRPGGHAGGESHGPDYVAQYRGVKKLPWILWFLPILIAYITPFYMGRCFILTFLGKPRDAHIHEHASEKPVMFMPLVVLAVMTLVSGPLLFRGMVLESAPQSPPVVPMIDGGTDNHAPMVHAAHQALPLLVGFSFVAGLLAAWMIYRNGLELATALKRLPLMGALHNVLEHKFYFDEVYNTVLVGGARVVAVIAGLFDNWIIDGLVNLAGHFTKWLGSFTGVVLDNRGVDGAVNGTGWLAWNIAGALRSTHTGIIRNYVLTAATVVAGLILCIWSATAGVLFIVLGAALVAAPGHCVGVVLPLVAAAAVLRLIRGVVFGQPPAAGQWPAIVEFLRGYFVDRAGVVELVVVLIGFAVLVFRQLAAQVREPELAAAP
ncbi:MAG: NAD(P)H-quinone oxidoreductase subunit 2, chloroplastic [Phycisphaerae bacterium]|nr:NAD(P)H-quinone oxidoreductase subunit 2, chloroplastic [Phycisphaerae bacterium]